MEEKVVVVLEKRIAVRRATTLAAIRLASLREQMKLAYQDADNETLIGAVELYPKLVSCSVCLEGGELPTVEEYLGAPDTQTSLWLDAVVEVNPHWFEYQETHAERQVKKKNRRNPKENAIDGEL